MKELMVCISNIIVSIFQFFGHDLSEKQMNFIEQFIKFGIVGCSNTAVSYMVYIGSLLIFKRLHIFPNEDYIIAQIIQFILSVLWSFFWNNKFVFKLESGERRNLGIALVKTYISYSFTGLFLNAILLIIWVKVVHLSEFIAPLLNLIISVPINFIINKYWAFSTEK